MRLPSRYPPAGFPVRLADSMAALGGADAVADERRLARAIADRLDGRSVHLFSSGRSALAVLLRLLKARAGGGGRGVVLLPAYGCYSLPASVAAAGLRVRCVDLDPGTLRLDPRALQMEEGSDVLALVAVHLLGLAESIDALAGWAGSRGIVLIDDAAQAFGATLGARPLGGCADAGILSFGRGKPLAALGGGALVSRGLDAEVEAERERLPAGPGRGPVAGEAAAYSILSRAAIYPWIERLPFLHVGETPYEPDLAPRRIGAARARLALRLLPRLEPARIERRRRWLQLADRLGRLGGLTAERLTADSQPAYLRYPLLAPDAGARDRVIAQLRRGGFGASRFYPAPLPELVRRHGLAAGSPRPVPGAERLAQGLVTLPVHEGVPLREIARMAELVEGALGAGAPSTAVPLASGREASP